MKKQFKRLAIGLTALLLPFLVGHAINTCLETGPHVSITCVQSGRILNPGIMTPTNVTVCAGEPIPVPTLVGTVISNGLRSVSVTWDCPENQWMNTNYSEAVIYTNALYFVPPLPNVIWGPGTYVFSAYLVAGESNHICPDLITNLYTNFTVTVVACSNDAVMIDVNFRRSAADCTTKSGFAATGKTISDYWNDSLLLVSNGSVTNLRTVEGTNTSAGLNISGFYYGNTLNTPDPMYSCSITSPPGYTGVMTLTNLSPGKYEFWVYAPTGSFSLTTAGTAYGTRTTADPNPAGPLIWRQGVQYARYTNVTVVTGQPVYIYSFQPWVAGLQIVKVITNVTPPPPNQETQMAIWDFGPDSGGYTELVTANYLNSVPTLDTSPLFKDANGKDGTSYTDALAMFHAPGQGLHWDDTDTGTQMLFTLDTSGWKDIKLSFHYMSEAGEVDEYDLYYRLGTAGAWILVSDNAPLIANDLWHRLTNDISGIAAIENAGTVQFLISDLDDDGNTSDSDNLRFDNIEFTGVKLPGTSITLALDRVVDGPKVSGVVGDPTDPIATSGVNFILAHPTLPASSLAVTVTSSDASVVPNDAAHLIVTRFGPTVNLRIIPVGRGYSSIQVTASGGGSSASSTLTYGGTFNGAPNANVYRYGVGISDASAAIALDDNYMLVANDEVGIGPSGPLPASGPHIFLMERKNSGRPVRAFDFSSQLNLADSRELDLEGSTRIGNRVYWIGALGNNKDGECRPSRNRIFATDITGRGPTTDLTLSGYYPYLREDLIAWDVNNWHGLGANHYGFATGSYCAGSGGVPPKTINGFNVEGLAIGPDGTTAYVAFRAPLVPAVPGGKALIVPIKNFGSWFARVNGNKEVTNRLAAADFAAPIELDLSGRSIRSIEGNALGEYMIVAGSYADVEDTGIGFQLYRWSGNPLDMNPRWLRDLTNPVPQPLFAGEPIQPGAYEAIVSTPFPLLGLPADILHDNGRSKWYSDASAESKELASGHQRFARETITSPTPGSVIARATSGGRVSPAVDANGTVYAMQEDGQNSAIYSLRGTDLSTNWIYPLESSYPLYSSTRSPVIGTDGTIYAGSTGYLHAINRDGTRRWRFDLGGRRLYSNIVIGEDGTIYVLAENGQGTAYAIRPDGTLRWQSDLQRDYEVTIALGEQALYVAHSGHGVIAIDSTSGAILWTYPLTSDEEKEAIAVGADNTIYVTSFDSDINQNLLTALRPDGTVKWTFDTINPVQGDMVLASNGKIFLQDDHGYILTVRTNGTLQYRWGPLYANTTCSSGLSFGPDGTLYYGTCSGYLEARDMNTGFILYYTNLATPIYSMTGPALSQNGILYVPTSIGLFAVYANSGWSPEGYRTLMEPYARSSWPTRGQGPLGCGQAVAGQPFATQSVWKGLRNPLTVNYPNINWNFAMGYHFTPRVNGEVTALGGFFAGTKVVKLFDRNTHALLAEAVVSDTNNWNYVSIAPVAVTTNNAYTVAVYLAGSGGNYNQDTAPFPRSNKFVRIDGTTYVDTTATPDAIPTLILAGGVMYGQADIKFRPYTDQMAIWNFGPDAPDYTESPAAHSLATAPTLALSGGLKFPQGDTGIAYTDVRGISHIAGRAAGWQETDNGTTPAQTIITLNTSGWDPETVSFDYKSDRAAAASECNVSYRIGTTGSWTLIAENVPLALDVGWHRLSIDVRGIPSIRNAPVVQFLISDLDYVSP